MCVVNFLLGNRSGSPIKIHAMPIMDNVDSAIYVLNVDFPFFFFFLFNLVLSSEPSAPADSCDSSSNFSHSVSMEVNVASPAPAADNSDISLTSNQSISSSTVTSWHSQTSSNRTQSQSTGTETQQIDNQTSADQPAYKSFLEDRSTVRGMQDIIGRMRATETSKPFHTYQFFFFFSWGKRRNSDKSSPK